MFLGVNTSGQKRRVYGKTPFHRKNDGLRQFTDDDVLRSFVSWSSHRLTKAPRRHTLNKGVMAVVKVYTKMVIAAPMLRGL